MILTYADFQKFVKLLRRHGYDVRYFVAGEYGSKKGRAHWHPILYFRGKVPNWELDKNIEIPEWRHGWTFWTKPSFHAVRYNCKYIMKGMGDDQKQGHLAMSKKPPLGSRFFEQLAARYVQQGLAPQDLFYSFPEVKRRKRNGTMEIIPFMLKGRPAELFLASYVEQWRARYGDKPRPRSQLVDLFEEWGRVINDEDKATENADWYQSFKITPSGRDLWAPLAQHYEWWETYWSRWNGEARQRQEDADDVDYWKQWVVAYDECVKAGAVPSDHQREKRERVGKALADYVCGGEPQFSEPVSKQPDATIPRWDQWHELPGWDYDNDRPTGWKPGDPIGWPPNPDA